MSTQQSNIKISIVSFLIVLIYCSLNFSYRIFPSVITQKLQVIFFFSLLPITAIGFIWGLSSIVIYIFRKIKKQQITKTIIAGVAVPLSFLILIPVSFFITRSLPRPLPVGSDLLKFNSEIWHKESSTKWNNGISIREQMLKDVIKNVLPGKSKEQIEELLGPSLETNYFSSIEKDFIYYLGPERDGFLNIDSEWLLLWLDENGNYKRYQIVND